MSCLRKEFIEHFPDNEVSFDVPLGQSDGVAEERIWRKWVFGNSLSLLVLLP